jgi:hypothetical protein
MTEAFQGVIKKVIEARGEDWASFWSGGPPDGDKAWLPSLIAQKLSYSANPDHLRELTLDQAVDLLEFVAVESMYMSTGRKLTEASKSTLAEGLRSLGPDARFFSNGDWYKGYDHTPPQPAKDGWAAGDSFGYCPISRSIFDTGLIGYNADFAFILWCEEND